MWIAIGATSPKYNNKWIQGTWSLPDGFPKQDNISYSRK